MRGHDTDNNLRVKDVVRVRYNPVTSLTEPKVTASFFMSKAVFDYTTKDAAWAALGKSKFERIAIYDNGDELWAVLSTEWD
jgi:hypothetical protein